MGLITYPLPPMRKWEKGRCFNCAFCNRKRKRRKDLLCGSAFLNFSVYVAVFRGSVSLVWEVIVVVEYWCVACIYCTVALVIIERKVARR